MHQEKKDSINKQHRTAEETLATKVKHFWSSRTLGGNEEEGTGRSLYLEESLPCKLGQRLCQKQIIYSGITNFHEILGHSHFLCLVILSLQFWGTGTVILLCYWRSETNWELFAEPGIWKHLKTLLKGIASKTWHLLYRMTNILSHLILTTLYLMLCSTADI